MFRPRRQSHARLLHGDAGPIASVRYHQSPMFSPNSAAPRDYYRRWSRTGFGRGPFEQRFAGADLRHQGTRHPGGGQRPKLCLISKVIALKTQFYFLPRPNGEYPFSIARDQTIATECSGEFSTRSCGPAAKSRGPLISVPSSVPETRPFKATRV